MSEPDNHTPDDHASGDHTPHRARSVSPAARAGIAIALAALVVAVVALVIAIRDDDDSVTTSPSTTVTSESMSTTSTSTPATTSSPSTTTAVPPLNDTEHALVVWPDPDGTLRYDDAVDAARGFAEDLAKFEDPLVGEFQAGDNRSGEIEVRAKANGAVTTVFVRQFGADNSWWVLGSATDSIQVDEPAPASAVDHPQTLRGKAWTFEGHVDVAIYRDGSTEPLGTTFVTGRGDELGPFEGTIDFASPAPARWGVVVFFSRSAEDGRVWEATTVRIGFIGAD